METSLQSQKEGEEGEEGRTVENQDGLEARVRTEVGSMAISLGVRWSWSGLWSLESGIWCDKNSNVIENGDTVHDRLACNVAF